MPFASLSVFLTNLGCPHVFVRSSLFPSLPNKKTHDKKTLMSAFSGYTNNQNGKTANDTITSNLYFTDQKLRKSPEWVTKLDSECEVEKGFAFFLHCFRVNRTYTGGCVGVPENIMKFIMQHIKPGCRITIDSLKNMGGELDD